MKKKKVLITLSIVGIFILTFIIYNYINTDGVVIASGKSEESVNNKTFSLMLETSAGSGEYQVSTDTTWPGSGYEYNENLSSCENGSTLIWNEETRSVSLKANISDKCYLYFDIVPPDVTLATNNTDNTYNPSTPATLSCNGATSSYNQKYQRVEISGIDNKYTNCTLTYQTPSSKNYLNNYIIGLSGTTQGTGQVVNENGYRYEGKDPNNYVWFNNELWRIIGVFDENSHGQSGQNLVKIIRADSIGGLAWHKSNTNDWTAASLMNLLNGAYLNSENGTGGEYCYGYSTSVPAGNCDYTETGINDTYRPMIENVTWYLGGHSTQSATAEAFYGYERGTTVSSGRPTETTGYIGLMYPSDYGYSVLSSSCARTTNLGSYNNATCAGQSWMYGQGYEWTITPYSSSSSYVFTVYNYGSLSSYSALFGYAARPVLYLDSSVYVIDGTGTQSDPYIIGMG